MKRSPLTPASPTRAACWGFALSVGLAGCNPGLKNFNDLEDSGFTYDDGATIGALTIDPVSLDFGYVAAGTSATDTVAITNIGGEVINLWDIALDDEDVFSLVEVSSTSSIDPSETLLLTVEFSPSYELDYSASLDMSSDAEGAGAISYAITGSAVPGSDDDTDDGGDDTGSGSDDTGGGGGSAAAPLEISPTSYDFGAVEVGDSESRSFTLDNPGSDAMVLEEIRFSNSDFDWANDVSLSYTLSGNSSVNVTLIYSPSAAGSDSGTATFEYEDADGATKTETVSLQGDGEESCDICQPVIDVDAGGSSSEISMTSICYTATETVRIENDGDQTLQIYNVYVNNDSVYTDGEFSVDTSGMSTSIAPGGSTEFDLEYLATSIGADLDYWVLSGGLTDANTLHIVSNDPDEGDYIISLSGAGLCPF